MHGKHAGRLTHLLTLLAIAAPLATGAGAAAPSGVTFNAAAFGASVAQAAPSPDGTHVAYQRKTPSGWRICVSRLDGSDARMVSSGPGDDVEPSWRPDGSLLAFASRRSGHYSLILVRPDGTGMRAITHGPQDARYPQWSPRPFDLPYDRDPLLGTQTDRSRTDVAPSDLQLLQMLARNSSDWDLYRSRFDTYKAARYYKLLFVQGAGDARRIATVREDGLQPMVLATGLPGPHLNPCWDRTATRFGFVVRHGGRSVVYCADYPVTRDLNDGEGKIRFGIDQQGLRNSIRRVAVVDGGAAQIGWAPDGDYLGVAAGHSFRLLPRPGLALEPITLPSDSFAPYGFGWMGDARTAIVTVNGGGGTEFRTIACHDPLLDVVNLGDFTGLEPVDRGYLAQNAFVAGGRPAKQMFGVYEATDYQNLPIFITTDSLLHLHHLVFDYLLRGVEAEHLTPAVISLVGHYLRASIDQAKAAPDDGEATAATANAAFFGVAARLAMGEVHTGESAPAVPDPDDPLAADRAAARAHQDRVDEASLGAWTAPLRQDLADLPPAAADMADREISLIAEHGGPAESPIFGGGAPDPSPGAPPVNTKLDYSDFVPRGHYTRSEVLRRYFLVSHWLSAGAFRRTPELTERALLIVSATDPQTMAQWQQVEDTVHQFAGGADDQDLTGYMAVARDVYGTPPTAADLSDAAKAADFLGRISRLPPPLIAPSAGPSFRFLPAPYTPDAEIMQGLVYDGDPPDVGTEDQPRYFALGLDVMAVLGSDRAHTLLQTTDFQGGFFDFDLNETQYANYDAQYQALRSRFASWTDADWSRSLYTRTLYAMLPLISGQEPAPPQDLFAQSPAWADKGLNAALGAWAELKHDVLPKQPVAIELGGEGGISEAVVPVQPVGFVEPAPEVYRRLGLLVGAERKTLADEGYLTPDAAQRLDTLADLLTMVQNLDNKQEAGTPLSAREVEQLRFYGGYQEHLTLVTAEGGEQGSTEGNDMAIVADVSSALSTKLNQLLALEEGVGRALPIYVAVPYGGHREIACGAIFTYYEFTHPADDRLTDEKWRQLLDTPDAPDPPAWTKSFISHVDHDGPGQ